MKNFLKKIPRKVYWISLAIVALIVIFLIWIYTGDVTSSKQNFLKVFPLPMALVNGHPIPMKDYIFREKVAGAFPAQFGINSPEIKSQIYSELIKEEEIRQLSWSHDVSVSQKQLDEEYLLLLSQSSLKDLKNLNLKLSDDTIKQQIIKPQLLLRQLKIWFNSQQSLNPQAYNLANSLVDRINKDPGLMPSLATEFSEDPTGRLTKGDMGFVQLTDIASELRENLSNIKPGEVKIIAGEKGIYIFRLEEQLGNKIHLRMLYLNSADFNLWLDSQLPKFKVIKLLKI